MIDKMGSGFKDYAPFSLRVGLAAIFIVRGAVAISQMQHHTPGMWSVIIAIVEILGGLFALIGYLTRWAACALMVLMVFRIVDEQIWRSIIAEEHQLPLAALAMCFALFGLGGGKWSVDSQHHKKDSG